MYEGGGGVPWLDLLFEDHLDFGAVFLGDEWFHGGVECVEEFCGEL